MLVRVLLVLLAGSALVACAADESPVEQPGETYPVLGPPACDLVWAEEGPESAAGRPTSCSLDGEWLEAVERPCPPGSARDVYVEWGDAKAFATQEGDVVTGTTSPDELCS